ncbi:hypothetical protein M231_04637 [Tremella mesenterica]|uniref:RNA polymerase-associated protein LEO1 n=1 Tax=Tremella mesenterica TaxID=5217 RepID=A0A4Q1BK11_TREME|nr:hypothetical protein M231_04637 [Tremella mesenterica]
MAEQELADDLFGDDEEVPPQPPSPSPAATTSKSMTPKQEGEDVKNEATQLDDLFGDEDADLPSTATPPSASPDSPRTPHPLEYEELDQPGPVTEEPAKAEIPAWKRLDPTDGKVWHLRLPAYVNYDSKPYHPDLFRATAEVTDGKTDPLGAKGRMIGVRNTMRWRWVTGADGEPTRQTNSRMLRWSDGSVSLQIGLEMFDVSPSHNTLSRPSDPIPPTTSTLPTSSKESTNTYILLIDGTNQLLVTQNILAGTLSLIPTSMTSKTHLEILGHVGQQHIKHSRMKILDDLEDLSLVQELLQKASTSNGKMKIIRKKSTGGERGRRFMKKSKRGGSSDEEELGLEGEYEEDDGFVVADSDNDDDDDHDGDGDDGNYGIKRKKGGKGKKKKGKEDDLDMVEEADKRIEAAAKERRKNKGVKSKEMVLDSDEDAEGEDEPMDMDMDMDDE